MSEFGFDMTHRETLCGCASLSRPWEYGRNGWHFRPSDKYPESPQMDVAFERCRGYRAAVDRRKEAA